MFKNSFSQHPHLDFCVLMLIPQRPDPFTVLVKLERDIEMLKPQPQKISCVKGQKFFLLLAHKQKFTGAFLLIIQIQSRKRVPNSTP